MMKFNVTFERWTEGDIEAGEPSERGFIEQDVSLHDAISAAQGYPSFQSTCGTVEGSSWPEAESRWVSAYCDEYITGDHVVVSVHLPRNITDASRARVVRALTGRNGM